VSHLPQLSASLLAKSLLSATDEDLELAGAGLRDSTRIAESDPDLWAEIISGNAAEIRPLLISLQNDLSQLIQSLDNPSAIAELLELGRQGRARIPGKHGGSARNYTYIPIVIDDKPGQLAAIFEECAKAAVNIEDLSIEHSPGQETGLITLALSPIDAVKIADHLGRAGWKVHPSR
jgi:prephenate dehydrogenase